MCTDIQEKTADSCQGYMVTINEYRQIRLQKTYGNTCGLHINLHKIINRLILLNKRICMNNYNKASRNNVSAPTVV